jgi:hypothetical protein
VLTLTPRSDYDNTSLYHPTLPHPVTVKCYFLFWCMYRASCTVYYPDQQMYNKYINNILYIHIVFAGAWGSVVVKTLRY